MRPSCPAILPLCIVMSAAPLAAQDAARPAIIGIVLDSAGVPIANAQVYIGANGRRAATGSDGRFRIENVDRGRHFVTARRIGYYPETQVALVDSLDVDIRYHLLPVARVLPVVVASANRGGISGVLHDSALTVVPGANIDALGSGNQRAVSDADGAFFLDVKPGKYMLEITRPGFATRLVSVRVPRDSGRRVVIGLTAATRPAIVRERVAYRELRDRMMRDVIRSTQIFTREDLDKMGDRQLNQLAAFSSVSNVDDRCWATVDGNPHHAVQLWALDIAELEMVEVYGKKATAPSSSRDARLIGYTGCPTVYVWTRR